MYCSKEFLMCCCALEEAKHLVISNESRARCYQMHQVLRLCRKALYVENGTFDFRPEKVQKA